jgi:hypothetical protein
VSVMKLCSALRTLIGGYVCKNVCKTVNCETCRRVLVCDSDITSTIIPQENNFYFNIIDRGGLKYSSDTLINILLLVFKVLT